MNIIIFGAPGSGKGTQAKRLVDMFSYKQISTGDLVRAEISSGSPTGMLIKGIVDAGDLPPDDVIIDLVEGACDSSNQGYIFDGFPRTENQARIFETMLSQKGQRVNLIIQLTVEDDVVKKRILGRYSCKKCGEIYNKYYQPTKKDGVCDICQGSDFDIRTDDTQEAIVRRLKTYHSLTEPVLSYFEGRTKVLNLDGSQNVENIFEIIKDEIKDLQENKKAV